MLFSIIANIYITNKKIEICYNTKKPQLILISVEVFDRRECLLNLLFNYFLRTK